MVPPTPIRRRADDQDRDELPMKLVPYEPLEAKITADERARAAIDDARAANEAVYLARLRQRRYVRVLLGQSRLLRALRRGQRDHGDALADLTAALIVRDARQALAVKAAAKTAATTVASTQATKAGAKVAAPLTVFVVVVELLKLLFGG